MLSPVSSNKSDVRTDAYSTVERAPPFQNQVEWWLSTRQPMVTTHRLAMKRHGTSLWRSIIYNLVKRKREKRLGLFQVLGFSTFNIRLFFPASESHFRAMRLAVRTRGAYVALSLRQPHGFHFGEQRNTPWGYNNILVRRIWPRTQCKVKMIPMVGGLTWSCRGPC